MDLREEFYRQLANSEKGKYSLVEYLDNSFCDEIFTADLNNDTLTRLYYVIDKYASIDELSNHSYKHIIEYAYANLVHPEDREIFLDLMSPEGMIDKMHMASITNFRFARLRYKLTDGSFRWVEQCVIAGKEYGLDDGVIKSYIFDIQNIKNRENGKFFVQNSQAFILDDKLTGLSLEKAFFLKGQEMLLNEKDILWSMVTIDIEHFTLFYEWYGRQKGDEILANVGKVLIKNQKTLHGLAGYFGKDDFAFLLPYDKKNIEFLYQEVKDAIQESNFSVTFMPAFGVSLIKDGISITEAFDHASLATTKAKADIRNRICVYSEEMHETAGVEYRILSDFMQAFNNDEVTFYLQPQCRMSTGKIVGAEALARWIKDDGTIIPPAQFIPILEKYGFIIDLDKYLWEKVIAWLKEWIDAGNTPIPISLNVSRADIFSIDIAKHFFDLTKKYNVPHNLIKLEITESAYTETTTLIEELVKKLRMMGFMVLMDDFGSGYSSLNMLSNLKVDVVKLDANFLNFKESEYERGIHILESVVNMTKIISVPIIVEGVEKEEQVKFLEDLGCRYVQGYYFYKPMPLEDFEDLIADQDNLDLRGLIMKTNEQFRLREFLDKNIYSDSMLNNILGAVALYSMHDNRVDIIRFNQQFYESVDVPDFHEKLTDIQRVMPEEDRPKIIDLLNQAKQNHFNGATGVLRFYKLDGTLTTYIIHFYYLGKKEGCDRFYGSASNITAYVDLEQKMKLIAKYSSDTIVFLKRKNNIWKYEVAAHGLVNKISSSKEEFENEFNNRIFHKRITDKVKAQEFIDNIVSLYQNKRNLYFTEELLIDSKEEVVASFNFDVVDDTATDVEYILTIRLHKNQNK